MGASPSKATINAALKRLQRKNPGVEFQILRASNGEVAIMPREYVLQCTHPEIAAQKHTREMNCSCKWCGERFGSWQARQAHKLTIESLHDVKAHCSCGGWSIVMPGSSTREAVESQFKFHLDAQS